MGEEEGADVDEWRVGAREGADVDEWRVGAREGADDGWRVGERVGAGVAFVGCFDSLGELRAPTCDGLSRILRRRLSRARVPAVGVASELFPFRWLVELFRFFL